jgi:hypothetical protein
VPVVALASLGALATLGALGGCGGRPALAFTPVPIRIGHDAAQVFDAVAIDADGDGDLDLVAATSDGLRYLRCDDGAWSDATPGSALDALTRVFDRLELDGRDLLAGGGGGGAPVRLAFSGVGSWHEGGAAPESLPQCGTSVDVDLSGDGSIDRASIIGPIVRVELRDRAGGLHDVTTAVASDALKLRGAGRRLLAGDLDGDGDIDLLAVGERLLVLRSNGGTLDATAARS